jgi:hypothetical protein
MATATELKIPQLSLPGNALVLGVNVIVARAAWKAGGWWKILAVINALSAMYTIGQISKQI